MKLKDKVLETVLAILAAMIIGAIVIALIGQSPIDSYVQLFKGAFNGSFAFGTTLEKFVPLLLAALAFAVSAKINVFNVGVDGQLYLGAMAAAWVGFTFTDLPSAVHIPLAFLAGMIAGALFAFVPAWLKVKFGVNEVLSTILLNYVAQYLTSYLVNNPFSAGKGLAQSHDVAESARLTFFMPPSRANTGLFIAIAVLIIVILIFKYTTFGYQLRNVGSNPDFTEYIGVNPTRRILMGMMLSGAIAGIAGTIEVLGIHGMFLDNFSAGIGFDGMLASVIAGNNFIGIIFISFFIASLKSGALAMERFTGVPKSLIDAIIALFILFATMQGLFRFISNRRKKKEADALTSDRPDDTTSSGEDPTLITESQGVA